MKKLKLNRETLRDIEHSKMRVAQGGVLTLVVNVCGVIFPALSQAKNVNCNLT